jgi:coenzyme F420-dependent glucose-6-phosphate dehydrogenase
MQINLRGMVLSCKHALPVMREQGFGAILNIASVAATINYPTVGYKTSKAAIVTLTEHLAITNAPYGIRAYAILPHLVDTPRAVERQAQETGLSRNEVVARPSARTPLKGRPGSAWDVAQAGLTFSDVGMANCARFVADHGVDVDKLLTDRWTLDDAERAYVEFDKQTGLRRSSSSDPRSSAAERCWPGRRSGCCGRSRMDLKIGYKASAEQFGPRELVELGVRAEELGLDSVWVSDHFLPWRHEGGHAPAALTCMAALGERTRRIQIGTSVTTPTFRYNPAVMAQTFATMALLYDNRIILGAGTGEALNEVAVSGMEWPQFKERFARLREAVELMRRLWTETGVDFDGNYYTLVNASIYDRPDQPVPIYIAAGGPVVARYAGRQGDGFICTSGKGMDLYVGKLMPAVADGAAKAARDVATIDRTIEVKLSYDRESAAALENCRFWAPLSLTPEQKHTVHSAEEMERLADELPIDQVARRWIVASDPDEAIEQIRPYLDAGLNHLVFHGPGDDQERFLGQLTEDVVPKLRALG